MNLTFNKKQLIRVKSFLQERVTLLLIFFLSLLSISAFIHYYLNGLGLAYNDARSHLDIGRRVVENLKPGLAQLGSVWLPLPHLLMVPTIWNDFMWHSGLSGALQSMVSYVVTGIVIYRLLHKYGVNILGRITGVAVFALNLNILYLQSTAMTELLLLATMTLGVYELIVWHKNDDVFTLIKSAFWIMLSTLIRYDGWFLFMAATALIAFHTLRKNGWKTMEGVLILFSTLAGFGVALWFLWNLLIFSDPLYFALGPYSARAQQAQLESAGVLATKGNLILSIITYWYAMLYNSLVFIVLMAIFGFILFVLDKKISLSIKIGSLALLAPFVFNVAALFFGHSVLFVQGLSGNSWFNVRYGIMMMPSIAVFIGYLISRLKSFKFLLLGLLAFVVTFSYLNADGVTIDDARYGSSGKNVSEVSGWLRQNVTGEKGFVLISAASHDAIIFSSGQPMSRFIHEGTGLYWDYAIARPDRWARWIIMRTNDNNDLTFRSIKSTGLLYKFRLVDSYPFADIYELKQEYSADLITEPVLGKQK